MGFGGQALASEPINVVIPIFECKATKKDVHRLAKSLPMVRSFTKTQTPNLWFQVGLIKLDKQINFVLYWTNKKDIYHKIGEVTSISGYFSVSANDHYELILPINGGYMALNHTYGKPSYADVLIFYPKIKQGKNLYWQCADDDNLMFDKLNFGRLGVLPTPDDFNEVYLKIRNNTI